MSISMNTTPISRQRPRCGSPKEQSLPSSTIHISLPNPNSARLCIRCAKLDLDKIFSTKIKNSLGNFVAKLAGTAKELEASECVLCKFFASVMPPVQEPTEGEMRNPDPYHIRAFSAQRVFIGRYEKGLMESDATLLGVVGIDIADANSGRDHAYDRMHCWMENTGYIFSDQRERVGSGKIGVRTILLETFDGDFSRSCLAYCSEKHDLSCRRGFSKPNAPLFLRVIDCKTRRIITAPPDCSYAALSYVWGSAQPAHSLSRDGRGTSEVSALHNCPKVVSDGLEVALVLNIRYLWVDKYCIDQLDASDKHTQIRQMDSIYANAEVTIIAAGSIIEDGLPGVGGTLRHIQPSLSLEGHLISSTLSRAQAIVHKSKWATRGWTYQEGLLSKRRLIFTDEQVFFECNGMNCAESVLLPLDSMHNQKTMTFRKDVPPGAFRNKSPGTNPFEIMRYIAEFSTKDLTFAEDRVNAMRGIFHIFEAASEPVYQLMGVPIPPSPLPSLRYRTLEGGFLVGLTWRLNAPGTRIPHFPSWSWAGWSGELRPELTEISEVTKLSEFINGAPQVRIEGDDGILYPFPSSEALLDISPHRQLGRLRYLHFEAYTISCSITRLYEKDLIEDGLRYPFRPFLDWDNGTLFVKVQGKDSTCLYIRLHMDRELTEEEFSGKTFTAIRFSALNRLGNSLEALLVEEFDGFAERVGVITGYALTRTERTWRRSSSRDFQSLIKKRKIKVG
jgi:hypothetical protein